MPGQVNTAPYGIVPVVKPGSPRRSREDWSRAALAALRDGGVERVRVEPLAARLGVTKGSFYWHFNSREELLDAALDSWVARGTEAVIHEVSAASDHPHERLRALWSRALGDSLDDLRTEPAIRDLGQREAKVRERIRRVDAQRMRFLREHFRAAGFPPQLAEARSPMLYSLLIGNYFIGASHAGLSRSKVLEIALDQLLAV